MKRPLLAVVFLALAALPATARTVDVAVIAVNDVHGNLEAPPGGIALPDPAHPGKNFTVAAGGLDRMATLVKRLRARHKNSIFVAAGDLIGASPLVSGLFHDEPVIEAMSQMGLAASAVGNHEFDKGVDELLRLQKGGCHPKDGCRGGHVFKGARFQYLAASTVYGGSGKTILPSYIVRRFEGVPIAFIGLTRHETGGMVSPAASRGLVFRDEAETVNALAARLKAQGVAAIVVMVHRGDEVASGGVDDCNNPQGPLAALAGKFDKAVDVVISGDSHFGYVCTMDGRLVTQAHRYTTLVTEIDLKLDSRTRDVVSARAANFVVDPGLPPDPAIRRLIDGYSRRAAPLAGRVVAAIPETLPVPVAGKLTQELALGDVIADGMRAGADHARIAFINPGAIRVSLPTGPVTHAALFAVMPFGNNIVSLDLTGAQLKAVLEQQWNDPQLVRIMKVSSGFHYAWDQRRADGDHIVPGSMTLDGKAIAPEATYRVAVPDFLAAGGDGMNIFTQGRNPVTGPTILESVEAWLPGHVPANGNPEGRVARLDGP